MNKELIRSKSSVQLTCMFVFCLYDRFWTSSGIRAAGLVVLWEEWHSGGNRAIKEAPDSGVRQQKTDLNRDLQQRAVRGGGHVDRTPACPRQPLRTSRSGWVWLIRGSCVCGLPVSMWTCRCGHKTHLSHFVTGMVWSRIRISSPFSASI